ncbi:hypothetical protein ABPG74_005069 [Tetrahymena malaccensis]
MEKNTYQSLQRSNESLTSQLSYIRSFINQKIKFILEILNNQSQIGELSSKQKPLLVESFERQDSFPFEDIFQLFSTLEERITYNLQTTSNQSINSKQINQEGQQAAITDQTESPKQIINQEIQQIISNQNDQGQLRSKIKYKKQQSVKIVTFQEDKCIQRKDEETIMLGSYKSSSDEQDLMQTSINNFLINTAHGNMINDICLGSQDILVSPIMKTSDCTQKQKKTQFFSYYDVEMRDMVANSQELHKAKNNDSSESNKQNYLPLNIDMENKNNLSQDCYNNYEQKDEQKTNQDDINHQVERIPLNKSKSFSVIEQNTDQVLKNRVTKRLKSSTPTNRSKIKRQNSCHIQKKSFFWSEKQLQTQEEQDQEQNNSFRSSTDFLKLKSNPDFSNLIKKNKPNQDTEDSQLIFSDKVMKHSKTGVSQEIIILLDQSYFYVFQNLDQINNFKRFYIKDINQLNTSSKNSNKCCISIKNEYQLILETNNSKQLIDYIVNIFVNVLKINPPKLQSYEKQIENNYQKTTNVQMQTKQNQQEKNMNQVMNKLNKDESKNLNQYFGDEKRKINVLVHEMQNGDELWVKGYITFAQNQINIQYNIDNQKEKVIQIQALSDYKFEQNAKIIYLKETNNNRYQIKLCESYDEPILINKIQSFLSNKVVS